MATCYRILAGYMLKKKRLCVQVCKLDKMWFYSFSFQIYSASKELSFFSHDIKYFFLLGRNWKYDTDKRLYVFKLSGYITLMVFFHNRVYSLDLVKNCRFFLRKKNSQKGIIQFFYNQPSIKKNQNYCCQQTLKN